MSDSKNKTMDFKKFGVFATLQIGWREREQAAFLSKWSTNCRQHKTVVGGRVVANTKSETV